MHEIHCVISGTVQGVGFRDFVQRAAMEEALYGWVKNMTDGTVEVVAQGTTDTLKEFVECLHEGSLSATVSGVAVSWSVVTDPHDDFVIRYD